MQKDTPYKPTIYRGHSLHYMGKGEVQVLDERGYVFKTLSSALDWIDGEVDI